MPPVGVRVVVSPAIRHADRSETRGRRNPAEGRVRVAHVARRVVAAPAGVPAVLQEADVVAHPGEPHHVLQVVPRQPPDRPANDVSENDDPHSSRPPMVVSDR